MSRRVDGPIGRSAKAWALVIGGMIVVGAVNVLIAWKWFFPDSLSRSWDPDAAVEAPTPAADAAPTPSAPTGG